MKITLKKSDIESGDYETLLNAIDEEMETVESNDTKLVTIDLYLNNDEGIEEEQDEETEETQETI